MGLDYAMVCKDCKIVRDIGQPKNLMCQAEGISNEEDMNDYSKVVEKFNFKASLIVSFMAEHRTHNCMLIHLNGDDYEVNYGAHHDNDYVKDYDYWYTK